MWVACVTGLPGTWVPAVHASCAHNEVAALVLRSLAPTPLPADASLGPGPLSVFGRLGVLARAYGGKRWSYLQTAESYSGSLRRRYMEAERSLRVDGPLRSSDAYLRAFLKAEKLGSGKVQKPRMIFPRSPRYNLTLASWLKPFEHWLWGRVTARRLFRGSNSRVVGKGLCPRRRANLIVRKFNGFRECVCFEVDGAAFEAHVSQGQVDAEHAFYLKAFKGCSELASVLSRQRFVGVTPSGCKFSRPGGRASGDFNTGMGNTVIMLAVLVSVLKSYRVKFDLLVDGDNALVFLESGDYPGVVREFQRDVEICSGHEMTLEKPVSYIEAIRFGRSAPVFLGHGLGWTMVREPEAILSGAFASHRWLREPVFGMRWVNGVARCELSLALGVPVIQSFVLSVLRQTETRKAVPADALLDYLAVGAWFARAEDAVEVTRECRISFERAFGWSTERQLDAERRLGSVVVGTPVSVSAFPAVTSWVEADPGLYEAWFDNHIWK